MERVEKKSSFIKSIEIKEAKKEQFLKELKELKVGEVKKEDIHKLRGSSEDLTPSIGKQSDSVINLVSQDDDYREI